MFLNNFFRESVCGLICDYLRCHQSISVNEELDSSDLSQKDSISEIEKIVADWNNLDCKENPKNWSPWVKALFSLEIGFLSLTVYMGLSIYTPGTSEIMEEFQIGKVIATLPLSLYVIGYGIGPLWLSPITEYYYIGRTPVYIVTLLILTVFQVPIALSKNIAGLCVLRFLSGIFASPALSTGAASVCDIVQVPYMPVVIGVWAICSLCGPSLGPLIGALLVKFLGWRWTFWFMLILSASSLTFFIFFLPETYAPTLIFRKIRRMGIQTDSNIGYYLNEDFKEQTKREWLIEYLWRPIEITIIEPSVLLINVYLALIYSVLYLWFEAFPIVFEGLYRFNLIEEGACYSSILVGVIVGSAIYCTYIYYNFTLKFKRNEAVRPEVFLPMAIFGSFFLPAGLFIFGWCATENIHWIVSLIGATFAGFANFIMFQTLLNYLGMSFPNYTASVFASNCLFRSVIAGVFPLFGDHLYNNFATSKYPVAWGSSILGFISALMVLLPITFYFMGSKLRANSRYSK